MARNLNYVFGGVGTGRGEISRHHLIHNIAICVGKFREDRAP